MTITYQWRRDETPISGATSNSYTLVEDDEGAMIDCGVTNDGVTAYAEPVGPITSAHRYPTLLAAPTSQYDKIVQSQPALRTPVQFGDLETVVVRVSDVDQKLHKYATQQSWNADGSRLLLNNNGPYHLLDVTDGFNPISTSFDAGFQVTFFDPVDPDLFWGQSSSARIRRGRLSGGSIPSVTVPGYTAINIGNGEGSISNDGRYLVFLGTRADGRDVCVWDTTTETVVTTIEFDGWGSSDIDNCHISQSGDYVVVAVERTGEKGHYVYERDGGAFLHRYETFAGHADVGYRSNGDEILLRQRANGDFVTVRLSDGDVQVELPAAAASWGKHFSCRNILRPGYGYISTFFLADQSAKYCYREVFALKLDGTGRIERFGQTMFPEDGSETYDGEGHCLPNPLGTHVAMKSQWTSGAAREYVMYVPDTMSA